MPSSSFESFSAITDKVFTALFPPQSLAFSIKFFLKIPSSDKYQTADRNVDTWRSEKLIAKFCTLCGNEKLISQRSDHRAKRAKFCIFNAN